MHDSPIDPGGFGLRDLPALITIGRDAARRRELARRPDLTYLFWESTLRCNLRCTHCGSSCTTKSPLKELTTAQILDIVDTIAEDFDSGRMFVAITGGEPLMRPDLFQVVQRLSDYGMASCIVTNGTLLTAERARRLFDAGMRTISISIDGTEPLHDAVRGEGSFAKAIQGVSNAREAGLHHVEVISCVRPASLDQLDVMERVFRDAGANMWRLITIDQLGRVASEMSDEMWMSPPQIRRLMDFVAQRRAKTQHGEEDFTVGFSCGGFLGIRREMALRSGEGGQCYAGLAIGSILCDGQVSACPSLPRSWAQGSALEQRFSDIWHGRFDKFRSFDWRTDDGCEGCTYFNLCLGGGLHERLAQPQCFCWLRRQSS